MFPETGRSQSRTPLPIRRDPAIGHLYKENARSPDLVDAVEWPLEGFPPPPKDGYWITKTGPPPPSKFPSPLPDAPLDLTLDPPVMSFIYPPPLPLTLEDANWVNKMMADVLRQRAHLEMCLAEARRDADSAYGEAGLADSELAEGEAKMQEFLDTVVRIAGPGFVRRMLAHVQNSVNVMSRPDDDTDGYEHDAASASGSACDLYEDHV